MIVKIYSKLSKSCLFKFVTQALRSLHLINMNKIFSVNELNFKLIIKMEENLNRKLNEIYCVCFHIYTIITIMNDIIFSNKEKKID